MSRMFAVSILLSACFWTCAVRAAHPKKDAPKVEYTKPEAVVTIKGKMVRPRFERRWGDVCLSIDSEHCEVLPKK